MRNNRFTPVVLALCLVIGIVIGAFYANHFGGTRLNIIGGSSNKLTNLLHIIRDQYVDDTDMDSLVESAIPQVLAELDPHSVYLTAEEAAAESDMLRGSFFGVGIEFAIRDDTLRIQNVLHDGPAEQAGLQRGDRIIAIDGETFVGKICTATEAQRRLKGEKDTKVTVTIRRRGEELAPITLTRGEIVSHSVAATYMLTPTIGYIRIRNFGETTYAEMIIALATLAEKGMESLVLDLRDNGGGYLQAAVQIANEFLPRNKLIVYTEGQHSSRHDYTADGHGTYQQLPLVVVINEASASAAEILAGALQDNDRATIVGRRSFGKGLVQQEIAFPDKSRLRLTVARYYTPTGRCIQKPYTAGDGEAYGEDILQRYEHGEFFHEDSIKHSGKAFHTAGGKTLYEGGGITPDCFVPEDTTLVTTYYKQAVLSGQVQDFADQYSDDHRQQLQEHATLSALVAFLRQNDIVEQFVRYATQHGIPQRPLAIAKSHDLLFRQLAARIVYNTLSEEQWIEYVNSDDTTIRAAINLLQ